MYQRVLERLPDDVVSVSSEDLAGLAGVNSAKVRKDLSYLGSYGTRGVGYDAAHLRYQIRIVLGLDRGAGVVIVGIGNLGRALANFRGFGDRTFEVVALVDDAPEIVGTFVAGRRVEPFRELAAIVADRKETCPAGRFADPSECGDLVAYICSAQAGFMSAQNIINDGGVYQGLF